MVKDPFYRQILGKLRETLDGNLFEACACDLLRGRYPTLVPVPGGNDGGMDGAIADLEGEAFPLVCTTQEAVGANLKRSLKRYLATGGTNHKVVVATSRALEPPDRRNLRDRARELGFTLIQVHERRAMAALLYRNSRWCSDLLDLSGQPSALSVLPPMATRPLVEIEMLGRDDDADWLRSTSGDRILISEPGVGKTYLLYRLALEGWGLFLATDDDDALCNALRDQKPGVVIVDDAHTRLEDLERLVSLRREVGEDFSILATTWKYRADAVVASLGVPGHRMRQLEPLPRRQIQQIYEELGVDASDDILRELVDQAANKPGLATTLATLWLEGDWSAVLRGDSLATLTLRSLERLVGSDEKGLLAAFSLGGRRGMPALHAGKWLGLSALDLDERCASLAAAGVLTETGEGCLAVQPQALRAVLLSSVFFREGAVLDYRELLDLAPGYDSAVLEIVKAAARGARVSKAQIQGLLKGLDPAQGFFRQDGRTAWEIFAGSGAEEAAWAFDNYPGDVLDLAEAGLLSAPEETLLRLLEEASKIGGTASSTTDSVFKHLDDWLCAIVGPERETIERRLLGTRAAQRFAEAAGTESGLASAFRLCCLALNPIVKSESLNPARNGLTLYRGHLELHQLQEMKQVWRQTRAVFEVTGLVAFGEFLRVLTEWHFLTRRMQPREQSLVTRFLKQVLQDVAPLSHHRPGLVAALARVAREWKIELAGLDPDPRFQILFPPITGPEEVPLGESESLEQWVTEQIDKSPATVVEKTLDLERDAKNLPFGYRNRLWRAFSRLAERVGQPARWFEALFARDVPPSWLRPFLELLTNDPSFGHYAQSCLKHPRYAATATRIVLCLGNPPESLLRLALERAAENPSALWGWGAEVTTDVAKAILSQPDPVLALAMAYEEWLANPPKGIRPELQDTWREAVLRNTRFTPEQRLHSHILSQVLESDPDLALSWLLRENSTEDPPATRPYSLIRGALAALDVDRRLHLLSKLTPDSPLLDELPRIIDHDVQIYQALLGRDDLRDWYLSPLRGRPGERWLPMAKLALEAGASPEETASATYSCHHTIQGSGLEHWQSWDKAFARLEPEAEGDTGLRETIRLGRKRAQAEIQRARARHQSIELQGLIPST